MPDQELTVYSSDSPRAFLVLAHGAGAGGVSPFMVRFARGMAARGVTTATFDFPYMAARRKVPDRAPVLENTWRNALAAADARRAGLPLFIGGKSMGGRIASHIASQEAGPSPGMETGGAGKARTTARPNLPGRHDRTAGGADARTTAGSTGLPAVSGLVFLGYPLHPPGRPDQRRDAHLPSIIEPMFFVQGSRDTFGTADEIRALLPRLQRATLHEVPGGDHSLKVRGARAKQEGVLEEVMDAVKTWIVSVHPRGH